MEDQDDLTLVHKNNVFNCFRRHATFHRSNTQREAC